MPAKAGHPVSNARPMRQMRAISHILWLLDRPPARAMTHTGTLGGGAAVVGRLQAGDVELRHLKHRLRHQAHPRPIPADPAEASRHSADDRALLLRRRHNVTAAIGLMI